MGSLLCKETIEHKDEEDQLQERIRPYYPQIGDDERQRIDALFVQLRTLNEMSGTHIERARKGILNELEKDIRKQVQLQATTVKREDPPVPAVESLHQMEEVFPAQNDEENSTTGCECAECRAKNEEPVQSAGSYEDGERGSEIGERHVEEHASGSGSEQEAEGEENEESFDYQLGIHDQLTQLHLLTQLIPVFMQTVENVEESEAAKREKLRKRVEELESQSSKCCICLEEKLDILFTPCSHVCVCEGCFSPTSLWDCVRCAGKELQDTQRFISDCSQPSRNK